MYSVYSVHDKPVWKHSSAASTWHIYFDEEGYWQFTDNIDKQVGSIRSSQPNLPRPGDAKSWEYK